MSRETKITDVEGDDLLVIWDWPNDGDNSVAILEDLSREGIMLDLAGIAKLRAALDDAEAAFHRREAEAHGVQSWQNCVASAAPGSVILGVFSTAEPLPMLPLETVNGKTVYMRRAYDLRGVLLAGYGITDVWLSKYAEVTDPIPQGVRVWQEEARS